MVVTHNRMDTSREGTIFGTGELDSGAVGPPIESPSSPSTPRSAPPLLVPADPMAALVQQMAEQEELRAARYAQERREDAAQKREEALIAAQECREEAAQLREDGLKAAREHREVAALMREEALRATQEKREETARLHDLLT